MRILLAGGGTGGHLYPGLAIARALVRLEPHVQPFFVGALRGIEKDVLPGTEFEHELLDLHPLYRKQPWRNWHTFIGAVRSWKKMQSLFARLEPRAAVGTGGYAAALALAAASRAGIPIALQEQNSIPGLTMRLFSKRAREIYLGFPEAGRMMRRGKFTEVLDTGNPIEPPPEQPLDRASALALWDFPANTKRVLLVVGGSQGARPINATMASALDRITADGTRIIWATGNSHFAQYQELNSDRARVVPYLSPISRAYSAADLVICRAGAITTAELCAWGIASVLIPLPTAAADHQNANARSLEKAGCAIVLPQSELSPEHLVSTITRTFSDQNLLARMSNAARARGRPQAAQIIAQRILKLCDVT